MRLEIRIVSTLVTISHVRFSCHVSSGKNHVAKVHSYFDSVLRLWKGSMIGPSQTWENMVDWMMKHRSLSQHWG